MSTIADIDPYYIKAITALHSRDHLQGGKPMLQVLLEDAIKAKTGVEKNLTPLLQSFLKHSSVEEYKTISIEESKTASSSDNELELDLLKEDLMCIICQGMDVGARNRLLECSDCHCLYHQECHQPVVTQEEAESVWVCGKCKEKRVKKSPTSSSSSHSSSKSKSSPASTPRHSSSGYKSSSGTGKSSSSSSKGSSSKSSSSKSVPSGSSSSSSKDAKSSSSNNNSSSSNTTGLTPNVRIISADKRMQIMKKKAAKLHEKKKLPR